MKMKTSRSLAAVLVSSTALIAPGLFTAILSAPTTAAAQAAPANSGTASKGGPTEVQEVIVTGSAIARKNYVTPSPVDVVTSKQLTSSGFDTLAAVLTNVTANGAGTLSNNNSEAFAGGASGIALRGLTVGATLTLVDGHRLAPYPLSDDGERLFTDVSSLPFDSVDRVEVLKDGASAIYGSDAIAGVVNVILKKQITGVSLTVEGGTSQHGGGSTEHVAFSAGKGDLNTDGYNMFVTAEYRNQDAIHFDQRSYEPWGNLDFTRFGGNDLRPGAPNFLNANQPATTVPYIVNTDGSIAFLGSGCNTAAMLAGHCTGTLPQTLLSPTRNINLLGGFTKDFADGWQAKLRLSFFDSKGQQTDGLIDGFVGYNFYPGASFGGNTQNTLSGTVTAGYGAIPYTLPANYLGSGSLAGGYLEGVIPQVGLPTIKVDSQTYRAALDVTGKAWGWDVTTSLGFSEVVTDMKFLHYVNYDTLYTDLTTAPGGGPLASGQTPIFNPLGGNSAAVINAVAPEFGNHATDQLAYAEVDANRKLFDLPGGQLSLAAGADVVYKNLDNPGPGAVESGAIGGTFNTYAIGTQTDVAAYVEADAVIWKNLEIDVAARDDWYNTYGNSLTPKVGVKYKALDWLTLRGTFSEGFRAPAPAEFGKSSTVFGLGGFQDPVLCGTAIGDVPADCSEQVGFVQSTTKTLKPETSNSFTGGLVFEPVHNWTTSFDYYNITINHQIVSASELPSYAFNDTTCVRGPIQSIPGVIVGYNGSTPILGTAIPNAGPLDACFAGYVNAQSTKTSGIDIQSTYRMPTDKYGNFSLMAEWTNILAYDLTSPSGVTYHLAGTHGPSGISGDTGNPRNRINGTLEWDDGPFTAVLTGYWISSYSATDPSAGAQGACSGAFNAALAFAGVTPSSINEKYCRVAGFSSVNLQAAYHVNPHLTVTFAVDNIADANAPIDAETYGGSFVPVNPSMDEDGIIGRFFRLGVTYKY
jgi:iron complex outermembrane receptor protein